MTFYCTQFDIIYFRNASSISEPLVPLIDVIAKKILLEVLRVIKKELDSKFSNWAVLCSTINLIIRLLMKEETAGVLVVALGDVRSTRDSGRSSNASSRRAWR